MLRVSRVNLLLRQRLLVLPLVNLCGVVVVGREEILAYAVPLRLASAVEPAHKLKVQQEALALLLVGQWVLLLWALRPRERVRRAKYRQRTRFLSA